MSDLDDFIFDADSLRHIDETEDLYFSQVENTQESLINNKKRKLDQRNHDDDLCNSKNGQVDKSALSSRKNLVLSLFEENKSLESRQPQPPTVSSGVQKKKIQNVRSNNFKVQSESTISLRKQMAAEIMSKPSVQVPPKVKSPAQLPLREIRPSNYSQKTHDTAEIPTSHLETPSNSPELFKTPSYAGRRQSLHKPPKTLVRRFPGPAGLLPGPPTEDDDSEQSQMDLHDPIHSSRSPNHYKMSHMADFCSQDTKKLFSGGAWKRMLDDLPRDLHQKCDISSIKRLRQPPDRIPLLAAIVHQIDLDTENPRVILKDISDSIEAIIHEDVPAMYPNVLQPGVVLLLRDVGVLMLPAAHTFITSCLLMIFNTSVLGVYTDNSRLVTTPALSEMLGLSNSENLPDTQPMSTCSSIDNSPVLNMQVQVDVHRPRTLDDERIDTDSYVSRRSPNRDEDRIESVSSIPTNRDSQLIEQVTSPSDDEHDALRSGFGEDLISDTEDELLSQIDIESIESSHRTNSM